jgi:hypothetical protein
LSTLKRKSGLSKTLARKIDTVVVDIFDVAVKLASAFAVLVLFITFLFLFDFLTNYLCAVPGLTGRPVWTNVADSDKGPALEPIQEASTNDTLVESIEQVKPDKAMEDIVDVVLVEQPYPQRVNILDAPVGQPQHPLEQADLQPAEVQSLSAVPSPLSFSNSFFLALGFYS